MHITEVSLFLAANHKSPNLRAYCSLLIEDALEIRNLRIVEPSPDRILVCMPSRHRRQPCPACRRGIGLVALYCSYCGAQMPPVVLSGNESRSSLHEDLVVPVNKEARAFVEAAVLPCYRAEVLRSRELGYSHPWVTYRADSSGLYALSEERMPRGPAYVE